MAHQIQARSGPAQPWAMLQHADLRSSRGDVLTLATIADLVANGRVDRLNAVPRFRFNKRSAQHGDLVWTTAMTKLASRRFVDVLESVHATGYRTFPVQVVLADRAHTPVPDIVGLAALDTDRSKDVCSLHGQSFSVIVSDRVFHALRAAGVTDFQHLGEPPGRAGETSG